MVLEDILKMAYQVIGGLGIFLLGMRFMSDGLQTVAGPSLRKIIFWATDNRFLGVIAGILVTCFVQSSSISTVMTVGFVNSGIMELHQAIGVIMGANIGTTITGWILVLKIGKYGLPILGVATFFYLFSKKESVKFIALAILGMGMVFFGLELMKNGFKPIKTIPEFSEWFEAFTAHNYMGVLKCAMVGCILTFIVQSSSATLGITIGLAMTGVLQFETAAALVLGENIGTTITALLASIGTNQNAKRAAYFHCIFNVVGVFIISSLFFQYVPFIEWILANFAGIPDVSAVELNDKGEEVLPYITAGIAMVHSVFNISNTVVNLPFVKVYANVLNKIVPDKVSPRDKKYLTHLDFAMFETPFAAVEQSRFEIIKMAGHTRQMMDQLQTYLESRDEKSELKEKLFERENILDKVQTEITTFLTDVLSGNVGHDIAESAKKQLLLSDEYESLSDYIVQILKLELRLRDHELHLTNAQHEEIIELHKSISSYFDQIVSENSNQSFQEILNHAQIRGDEITVNIRAIRSKHWDRISEEKMDPLISTTYTDMITSYRKLKTLLYHVAETQAGVK